MKKIISLILFLMLTNCAYKPKINPEASIHPHTGENLAGKYYYYLATCEDMWEKEAGSKDKVHLLESVCQILVLNYYFTKDRI